MNQLITTTNNEHGEIILSGRELHEFLEVELIKGISEDLEMFINKLITISSQSENSQDMKYQLLKLATATYDYFHLVTLDTYLELLYSLDIIDEDLTDNKRIPNGSDNQYGRFFEKRILAVLSKYLPIKSRQYKSTDAIGCLFEKDYIIEIKCGSTNTEKQIKKYQESTGIENFITVNGHANSINFTHMDVYRISKYLIALKLNNVVEIKNKNQKVVNIRRKTKWTSTKLRNSSTWGKNY